MIESSILVSPLTLMVNSVVDILDFIPIVAMVEGGFFGIA